MLYPTTFTADAAQRLLDSRDLPTGQARSALSERLYPRRCPFLDDYDDVQPPAGARETPAGAGDARATN